MLPTRATLDDIEAICGYLITKPIGATLVETKAVLDQKHLDYRKLNAMKFWGLVEEYENKLKITDLGRQIARNQGVDRSKVLLDIIRNVQPYQALIERVVHRQEKSITATEIAAHWHEHFKGDVSDSEQILNDQTICFLQIAQGADLGELTIGRRGLATRFEFNWEGACTFVSGMDTSLTQVSFISELVEESHSQIEEYGDDTEKHVEQLSGPLRGNRVFLTHGKNLKILDQVKQIVTFGKFEPVVAMEHESLAKPVPKKVMDEMRTCDAAVIHVSAERVLLDEEGVEVRLINENVLIEIGAAMALYEDRFILLVEEGVDLPSNLQGLYECRYKGTELDMPATMKLLQAFNEFGSQ